MANHEKRLIIDKVHLLLAFRRHKDNPTLSDECLRIVIKNYYLDLSLLFEKCKRLSGIWTIHRTVNARDTEKARKWLIHKLIDAPQFAGCVDSIWRTALLQSECKAENKFMFDIDTKEQSKLNLIEQKILLATNDETSILEKIETSNGWHYITIPFDSRDICNLSYVSLIRDGYYFIKKIGG